MENDLVEANHHEKSESAKLAQYSKSETKPDRLFVTPNSVDHKTGMTTTSTLPRSDCDNEKRPADTTYKETVRKITGWRWALIVTAILSSTFLFALDNTIVADVQPVIVVEFNSLSKIAWLSSSFLIGAASTNLIWGKIYGQLESKWTYIFCICMFEVGSAICGAAPDINSLIIGRAICGVGGSGMYVGVMTLLAANTTLQERPLYIGSTGFTWGLGTVLGPIIGGAFAVSSAGWRWAFYINLFFGVICAPVYFFMIPCSDPRPGVPLIERAKEMDYVGGLLTVGAFISGVMAISFGGVQYQWSSPQIIGMFVCSAVLFITLGFQQVFTILTTKNRRVLPIEFFSSKTLLMLFACTAAGGAALFTPIYMIPILFQFTRNDSALQAGVRLLPFIFVAIFGMVINGATLSIYGLYMPWFTVGGTLCIIGSALMYTVSSTTSVGNVYGYSIIIGFANGIYAQSGFSIAQAIVEPHLVPLAIGFITCAQVSGVTIALAIANSVFLNKSKSALIKLLPGTSPHLIDALITGEDSSFVKNLSNDLQDKVLDAVVKANSSTYAICITAGVVVLIMSLGMKRERLFIAAGTVG